MDNEQSKIKEEIHSKNLGKILSSKKKAEQEKKKILRAYYKKYLEPNYGKHIKIIYKCQRCKDSGWIVYYDTDKNRYAKKCRCVRQRETDTIINKVSDKKLF